MTKVSPNHVLSLASLSFVCLVVAAQALPVDKDAVSEALGEEATGYGPITLEEGRALHLVEDDDERPKRFDSFMNGFGTAKRNFDEINRSSFGFHKRNFDEINRSNFGFNKRNFDEINRSNFGFNKRNFDEINRSAFGFNKRNFDEINRSAFGFNKRNFDEINRSSFGFHSPSAIRRSQKPSVPSGFSYYFPFFKRSQQPEMEKKSFDEINRSHFGFSG